MPFKLKPCFKDYIWGGDRLKTEYKKESDLDLIAESWELSAHDDGSSIISEAFDESIINLTFKQFVEAFPEAIGKKANADSLNAGCGKFPVLIKLIDAKDNLSIQVHPNDEFAAKHENSPGKTEMWYVLDHDKDAFIYMGLNKDMTRDEFKKAVTDGTILTSLNKVTVNKGDAFLIDAGTVHAINKGILIAEIQQNSNITYRVYDYNRVGADGNPRELHINKAVACANLKKFEPYVYDFHENNCKTLASCNYFTVKSINPINGFLFNMNTESFASILITDGEAFLEYKGNNGKVCKMSLIKGDSVFIPAKPANVRIHGEAHILLTTL